MACLILCCGILLTYAQTFNMNTFTNRWCKINPSFNDLDDSIYRFLNVEDCSRNLFYMNIEDCTRYLPYTQW